MAEPEVNAAGGCLTIRGEATDYSTRFITWLR